MAQIEYGDYYKFTASAGITLIAGAIVVPWMFLRESFDLALEASKIALLTPDAQQAVHARQHLIAIATDYVPWASGVMAVAGIVLTIYGLASWRSRQVVRDVGENLDIEKKHKELIAMTPQEIEAKAREEQEIAELVEPETVALQAAAAAPVTSALAVEQALLSRISNCLGPSMKVMTNQRLGKVEFDAIVSASAAHRVIVEIKYIRKGFNSGWMMETMTNLSLRMAVYGKTFDANVSGLVLIVISSVNSPLARKAIEISKQLKHSHPSRLDNIRVETIYERDIASLSCDDLRTVILGQP